MALTKHIFLRGSSEALTLFEARLDITHLRGKRTGFEYASDELGKKDFSGRMFNAPMDQELRVQCSERKVGYQY